MPIPLDRIVKFKSRQSPPPVTLVVELRVTVLGVK